MKLSWVGKASSVLVLYGIALQNITILYNQNTPVLLNIVYFSITNTLGPQGVRYSVILRFIEFN